uniref:ATP-dependent DNA helicase n=1 Tax=Myotis myotis TaxID=51298 RepID=A0A7J8AM43_MYOMY|nr:hypothetical protein mMyoMyo1_008120 [Myotis myotis]
MHHGIQSCYKRHRLLREIMNLNVACGGKVLLLGGDFRQCLSFVPHAMRATIVQTSLKYCNVWGCFRKLSLTTNMRSEDFAYSEWLLKLGDGKLDSSFHLRTDIIEIPHEMICSGSIIKATFGNSISIDNIKKISKHAILCPKNEHVQNLNEEILDILDGEFHTYLSDDFIDSTDDAEKENFPIEFLNSITPSGIPCHKLKLKVGAIIMLLRNLNSKWGLCNGTRFIIKRLLLNIIKAEVLTGSAEGEVVLIPRIDLSPSDTGLSFKLIR